MKRLFFLPLLATLALASSAIKPLSGESLSLALLRANWLSGSVGFPEKETLSVGRAGQPWNSAQWISEKLTELFFFNFGEVGVLSLQLVILSLATLVLLSLCRRISSSTPFSLVVTALAAIAIWGDTRDISGAVGVFLGVLQLRFLVVGWFFRALVLLLIHPFFDASYFVIPVFFLFSKQALRTPRFKDASLLLAIAVAQSAIYGLEFRHQSDFTVLASSILLAALSLLIKGRGYLGTVFTIAVLGFAQLKFQFPALALILPVLLTVQWRKNRSLIKIRLSETLERATSALMPFYSGKNGFGLAFLFGAFIYFNFATLRSYVDEAKLPTSAMDKLTEAKNLPLHSPTLGGFIGLRLNSVLPRDKPRNIFDTAPVRYSEYQFFSQLSRLYSSTATSRVRSDTVLCRGSDNLCKELKKSWTEAYATEIPKIVEQQLATLGEEKQRVLRARVEQTRFFLLQRPESTLE